jgi:hypothetical protein
MAIFVEMESGSGEACTLAGSDDAGPAWFAGKTGSVEATFVSSAAVGDGFLFASAATGASAGADAASLVGGLSNAGISGLAA